MTVSLFALCVQPEPIRVADMSSLDTVTRQLPEGFYTTFRTYDRKRRGIGLRQHLKRLYEPAERFGLIPCLDSISLRRMLAEVLRDFEADEARLRLVLTRGGEVYLAVEPFRPLPPEVYEWGVFVVTTSHFRENPTVKETRFIEVGQEIRFRVATSTHQIQPQENNTEEKKPFEALLTHNEHILEGLTSNFFYVRQGILGTAGRGILPGGTRRIVLRLARREGVPIRRRALPIAEIPLLDEAFLTSSSRGVVPIVQIDGQPVGDGRVGEVTRRLQQAYETYVQKIAEKI
ncbi:MAG: aminotransferase class IV [Anaerolineales bacterium]|nr:aminotransferase class IV [Anaerolineales bacterium]